MSAENNLLHLEAWLHAQGLLTLEAEPGELQRAETIILNIETLQMRLQEAARHVMPMTFGKPRIMRYVDGKPREIPAYAERTPPVTTPLLRPQAGLVPPLEDAWPFEVLWTAEVPCQPFAPLNPDQLSDWRASVEQFYLGRPFTGQGPTRRETFPQPPMQIPKEVSFGTVRPGLAGMPTLKLEIVPMEDLPHVRYYHVDGFVNADYVEFKAGESLGYGVKGGTRQELPFTRKQARSFAEEGLWRRELQPAVRPMNELLDEEQTISIVTEHETLGTVGVQEMVKVSDRELRRPDADFSEALKPPVRFEPLPADQKTAIDEVVFGIRKEAFKDGQIDALKAAIALCQKSLYSIPLADSQKDFNHGVSICISKLQAALDQLEAE